MNETVHEKIVVKDLYKIFGEDPERAFPLLKEGRTKDEINKATGLTVGVQNANFSINEGEIFVGHGLVRLGQEHPGPHVQSSD